MLYLLFGLVAAALSAVLGGRKLGGISGGLAGVACAYLTLPPLAWGFVSTVTLLALCVGIGVVVGLAVGDSDRDKPLKLRVGAATLGALTILAVIAATSFGGFHAGAYRAVIGAVDTLDNHPELSLIDAARFRVVDEPLARRMAERVLGEDGALGSQVQVGRMTLQLVGGEWLWVGPLNHANALRWAANPATPGYVTVSATTPDDPQAARLVLTLNGQPMALRYNGGGLLWTDPARVIYANHPTTGLGQMHFEIDDTGRPYWVMTTYQNTVGFGGGHVTGAILLDPQTGEQTRCTTAECPDWIDMLQDERLIERQIGWWGEYAEGWWNPSGRNKLALTPHTARAVDAEGRQYFYTGIRSVNSDQGTVGYILTDTRTGKTTFYRQAGAAEDAAMRSAQGTVQEKGYVADAPVPYNIGGTWSYFIPLKDQAGFPKAFAFVSVANDQVLAVGDTPAQALRAYRQRLVTSGRATGDNGVTDERLAGIIARIASDVRDGTTYYLLTIEGVSDRAFLGTSALEQTLPLALPGDSVEVQFVETGRGVVDLTGITIRTVALRQSTAEARLVTP